MKPPLLLIYPIAALSLASCTTLENRRDMYFPQKVNGPYTRMAKEWDNSPHPANAHTKTVRVDASASPDGKNYVSPQH